MSEYQDILPLIIFFIPVFYVYFIINYRLIILFEKLNRPIPSPGPMVLTSKLTIAFMKIFEIKLEVEPKTKEERELVIEIKKTIKFARILLIVAGILALLIYIFDNFF